MIFVKGVELSDHVQGWLAEVVNYLAFVEIVIPNHLADLPEKISLILQKKTNLIEVISLGTASFGLFFIQV